MIDHKCIYNSIELNFYQRDIYFIGTNRQKKDDQSCIFAYSLTVYISFNVMGELFNGKIITEGLMAETLYTTRECYKLPTKNY